MSEPVQVTDECLEAQQSKLRAAQSALIGSVSELSGELLDTQRQLHEASERLAQVQAEYAEYAQVLQMVGERVGRVEFDARAIGVAHRNRIELAAMLRSQLNKLLLPQTVLHALIDDDVWQLEFAAPLQRLERLLRIVGGVAERYAHGVGKDVSDMSETLLHGVVVRIRGALLQRLQAMTVRETNVPILQAAVVKRAHLLRFVAQFAGDDAAQADADLPFAMPNVYAELRGAYVRVMTAVYQYNFSTYRADLAKLQSLSMRAVAQDTLGAPESADSRFKVFSLMAPIEKRQATTTDLLKSWTGKAAAKPVSRACWTRLQLLRRDARLLPVVYYVARDSSTKLRFEYAWWSFVELLSDAVVIESNAHAALFAQQQPSVFDGVLDMAQRWFQRMVDSSFDCIEVLLLFHCNVSALDRLHEAPALADNVARFFDAAQALLINRFALLMSRHVASLQAFSAARVAGVRAHFVTQRYCEFVGALFAIMHECYSVIDRTAARHRAASASGTTNALLLASLKPLQAEYCRMLERLAALFERRSASNRAVFLINNWHFIVANFRQPLFAATPLCIQYAVSLQALIDEQIGVIAELLLSKFSGIEPTQSSGVWQCMDAMRAHVVALFADFTVSQSVLQRVADRLVEQHEKLSAEKQISPKMLQNCLQQLNYNDV